MVKVKICGITSLSEVEFLNRVMPDYIGFVFSKSIRKVTAEEALTLSKYLSKRICRVGVFRNEEIYKVREIALSGVIDVIQLHGNENEEYIKELEDLNMEVWKGITIKETLEINFNYNVDKYLLDGNTPGSGECFNWESLQHIPKGIILAGGINEENVLYGIEKFMPYAVDVSSGVEKIVNGIRLKDENKTSRLIRKVRSFYERKI